MPPPLGATCLEPGRTNFRVWAPHARSVAVHLHHPSERFVPMDRRDRGYYEATVEGAAPGALYTYLLNETLDRPDPASRFQPHGIHAPSQVIDTRFAWNDAGWHGLPPA